MSILAERGNTVVALDEAQRSLYASALGGAGLMLATCLVPKDMSSGLLRLLLVVGFFLGLLCVIWSAREPLEAYLRARLEVCLEDFGVEGRAIGHSAIDALSRFLRPITGLLLVATGLLAANVISYWPVGQVIAPLRPLLHWGTWIVLFDVPVQLFLSSNRLSEVFSLWQSYRLNVARSRFRPRTIAAARARMAELDGPPVTVREPYGFHIGGMDWSWTDFQKNAIVFGQTGSGKTVAVLNALLDGLLSSADGQEGTEAACVLILDPKGDYRDKIGVLCERLGRSADLCVLDPNSPADTLRWNPFDSSDDALEISERFAGVLQLLGMKNTQDTFWIDTAKTFLRHAVGLLRATGRCAAHVRRHQQPGDPAPAARSAPLRPARQSVPLPHWGG
jgi:hypothetical protein